MQEKLNENKVWVVVGEGGVHRLTGGGGDGQRRGPAVTAGGRAGVAGTTPPVLLYLSSLGRLIRADRPAAPPFIHLS